MVERITVAVPGAGNVPIGSAAMARAGWRWIAGKPRGVYVTNDPAAVQRLRAEVPALTPPRSNGTHARAGVPLYQFPA